MSLPQLTEQLGTIMKPSGNRLEQGGVFSLTLATVKNIKDEQKLNRVRCLRGTPRKRQPWPYKESHAERAGVSRGHSTRNGKGRSNAARVTGERRSVW